MDIDALRSFIAFVDTGSFTRAAKQICRTQGAISMQMKKLEEEVGQSLFRKEGRYLVLTEQGRLLVSYARRLIAMHDQALGDLSQRAQHKPLRVGCPDDYAESILPGLVALLRETYPELALTVHCDCSTQLRLMLDNGDIDVAILTRAPEKEEGYLLKHDRGVWVHAGCPELLTQEVLPLVLYEADCKFHSTAVDGLEKQARAYRLVCTSASATVIKSLLRKGVGVAAMARSSVPDDFCIIGADAQLPPLPAVDIVLAVAPKPHPLLSLSQVAMLSARYREEY